MATQRRETYIAWNGAEIRNDGNLRIPYDLMDMVGDYCTFREDECTSGNLSTMNNIYGKKFNRRYRVSKHTTRQGGVTYRITCIALQFAKPAKPVQMPSVRNRVTLTTCRDGVTKTVKVIKHPYEDMHVGDHFLVEGVNRDAQSIIACQAYDESKRLGAVFTVIRTDSTIKITRKS